MKINILKILVYLLVLTTSKPICAQNSFALNQKYLIIDLDKVSDSYIGHTFIHTKAAKGMDIYILNVRYNIKKSTQRSWIKSDADFMFSFYIIPEQKLRLEAVDSNLILLNSVHSLDELKDIILKIGEQGHDFEFSPIVKIGNIFYRFSKAAVPCQAFDLKEESQYFPKYGAESNICELNFLAKPYSKKTIDSLRKVITKDSTSYMPFYTYWADFYDKWFIKKIDRQENSFDFWVDPKFISSEGYGFGRVAKEIRFKINIGITDFKITPQRPLFPEEYFDRYYTPIEFNFKEFMDIKKIEKN